MEEFMDKFKFLHQLCAISNDSEVNNENLNVCIEQAPLIEYGYNAALELSRALNLSIEMEPTDFRNKTSVKDLTFAVTRGRHDDIGGFELKGAAYKCSVVPNSDRKTYSLRLQESSHAVCYAG
jgi:hypothetical protein